MNSLNIAACLAALSLLAASPVRAEGPKANPEAQQIKQEMEQLRSKIRADEEKFEAAHKQLKADREQMHQLHARMKEMREKRRAERQAMPGQGGAKAPEDAPAKQ